MGCPACGCEAYWRLPPRTFFVLVRHRACHRCGATYAPKAYAFRTFAVLLALVLLGMGVLGAAWMLAVPKPLEEKLLPLAMCFAFAGLGAKLVYDAVTCRRTYPLPRGFQLVPVAAIPISNDPSV